MNKEHPKKHNPGGDWNEHHKVWRYDSMTQKWTPKIIDALKYIWNIEEVLVNF